MGVPFWLTVRATVKVVLTAVLPVVATWKVHCQCPAAMPGDAVPVTTPNMTGEPDDVPADDVGSAAVESPESMAVRPPVELMYPPRICW